jgi:ribosomal protein L7/L12
MMDAIESQRLTSLIKQVNQLERKVDFLLKHLNLEYKEEEPEVTIQPQVEKLLQQGKQLDAIKLFQMETGLGLREAKEAVMKIEQEMKSRR